MNNAEMHPRDVASWEGIYREWYGCSVRLPIDGDRWTEHDWNLFTALSNQLLSMAVRVRPLPGDGYRPLAELVTAAHERQSPPILLMWCHQAQDLIEGALYELLLHLQKTKPDDQLNETDQRFLAQLYRLGATGPANKTNVTAVVKDRKTPIGNRDSQHVKDCIDKLKGLGLIETKTGPNGGVWLTPKGLDAASS